MTLNFKILGPLEIRDKGNSVDPGPARHQKVLTALLLSADRVVPLPRLIDAAWGENPPATARKQVRNIVSDLRRTLNGVGEAGLLPVGQDGYRLHVAADALDVSVFDDRVARGRRYVAEQQLNEASTEFRAALSLWRGPALAGLESPALDPQRAVLEERRLTVLEEFADLELTIGRHHELSAELAQWVAEYPLRERLIGFYMLALYRAGRQAEALQVFQDARRVLIDQLGIEPGADLQRLHQRILTGDEELSAPRISTTCPQHFLPRDICDFTGRAAELERIRAALPAGEDRAGAVAVIAIDGMAGVGKTALAVHVAHDLTDRYPDAQIYIDLHAHTADQEPLGTAAALDALLRAVGVPGDKVPGRAEERAALWRSQLAGRRVLVVLDNAAGSAQVRPLLPGTPGCLVLVTSRRRLPDLEGAHTLSLGVLPPRDATELFTRVAGEAHARADLAAVQEVVRVCGYLPLAVRIAAARLRTRPVWSVTHLIERLREERRLTELTVGDRGVAAAFALSYRHLTADQRRVFRLLGLYPGADFDLHTAAALADMALEDADRLVEQLVDFHLLEQPTAGRYRFHDLLRLHAVHLAGREVGEDDRHDALGRVLDHYRHTAALAMNAVVCYDKAYLPCVPASTTPAPAFADSEQAIAWLETERPNLPALVAHAAEHGWPTHVTDLSNTLWCFFEHRGSHDETLDVYTRALTTARGIGDRDLEGQALHYLGLFHRHHGRNDKSLAHYEAALALARETGNRVLQGRILGNLGPTLWHLGRGDEALTHYRRALAAALETGDLTLQCRVSEGLGSIRRGQGRYDQALGHYKQALALARETGNFRRDPFVLAEIGGVYGRIGRHDEAIDHLQRGLDSACSTASRLFEGFALYELGALHGRIGHHHEAIAHLDQALDLAHTTSNGVLRASALCGLGTVYMRLGLHDEAIGHLHRALDLARSTTNRPLENEVLNGLGETARRAGDPRRALTHHREAFVLATEIGTGYELARALDGIAHVHHDLGHDREAAANWRQALTAYTDLGVPDSDDVRALLDGLGSVSGHGGR
ncbi:AfsR/SARP family transcriptional regulator [Actinomadura spongiicola]|nr:tetratricopeptide repeat protein [Actinomadura spongiicola]